MRGQASWSHRQKTSRLHAPCGLCGLERKHLAKACKPTVKILSKALKEFSLQKDGSTYGRVGVPAPISVILLVYKVQHNMNLAACYGKGSRQNTIKCM